MLRLNGDDVICIAMLVRRWACLLILLGTLQAAHPPVRLFTTDDGLVRNWITRIRRDSRGYLWFCTVEGLSIFDGTRFQNFTTRDGLPSRLINDVLETSGGEYWIATDAGISRFHAAVRNGGARFENFRIDNARDANQVLALLEDSAKNIWCGTGAGLYRLVRANGEVRAEHVVLDQLGRPRVASLLEDGQQRLWAAADGGVWIRRRDGQTLRPPASDVPKSVRAMLADNEGRIWIGGDGLIALDSRLSVAARYPTLENKPFTVFALHRDAAGELWVGSRLLFHFRPDDPPDMRFRLFRASPVLEQADVGALESDIEGNLWLAVSNLGAARLSREPMELFSEGDGLASHRVHGFTESRTGVLYTVTGDRHILNEFTGSGFVPRPAALPPVVTEMGWGEGQLALQDRAGEWWFASACGVLRYPASDDPRTLARATPRLYNMADGLPSVVVLRLFQDSRGDIWAGTSNGAARWSRATGAWTAYGRMAETGGELRAAVHAIAEDRSGAIWLGFASPRLWRIQGSRSDTIQEKLAGFVNALLVDHSGRLWAGTSQGGVVRIDDPAAPQPRMRVYTMDQGLASNHVFSLAEDRFGRIYIAGGHGVDRLDPDSGTIRNFSQGSGLPPGETERMHCDRNGYIWFASNFGVARYRPEPEHTTASSRPLLRGLTIDGTPQMLSVFGERSMAGLELAPGQNNIGIEYRALHFATGERQRYQYRLLGASDHWSAPADLQMVQYAKLSPGRYRFEVRGVSEDGGLSEPATLDFRLLPPVWQRWWFLTAAVLAISSAAYVLHRYRLRYLLALERVRTRLATDLHDDLGAGLSEIAILAEVVRRKPADGAGEMLDHVAHEARRLRAALSDIVWTVDPRRDRLSDLVDRMRETALPMLQNDGRSVEFTAPPEHELAHVDLAPDLRRHLLLFFKETATNVARHAGATRIEIRLDLKDHRLHLCVQDNGRGFDPKSKSTGHGLASMRHRAGEINGEFLVESSPGQGTKVELDVKLGQSRNASAR